MKRKPAVHSFPLKMKAEREKQRLSQTDLAKKTGFLPSNINHFEGGRREPSLTNAVRIANGLDVNLGKLV